MNQTQEEYQNSFYAAVGLERLMQHDKIVMQNTVRFSDEDQIDSYRCFFPIVNQGTQRSDPLFQINSPINWKESICWPCRSQEINIYKDADIFLQIKKDFTFTIPFLSFCDHFRPHYSIYYLEEGQRFMMGKIINPIDCFGNYIEVLDDNLELLFKIYSKFCQCQLFSCFSLCCPKGCIQEGCTLSIFEIYNTKGILVGNIQKKKNDEFHSKTIDYMQLNYPKTSNEHQRALLLASMLYIEFKFFAAPLKQQN